MKYILKISPKAFIVYNNNKIEIISDYQQATQYDTIGKAMKAASEINQVLENPIVKVMSIK